MDRATTAGAGDVRRRRCRARGSHTLCAGARFAMSGGIVLVGLSGSGKSTVGKELALALRLPLFDTDRLVEQTAGCTVADIFSRRGEEQFRLLEARILARACGEG